MASRDPTAEQLNMYKTQKGKLREEKGYATNAGGAPLYHKDVSLTVGPGGPLLLHDVQFVEELAHFVRERIPERVLHAKGAGAFGTFTVTDNRIANYTSAKVFEGIGKATPVIVRFSTTAGEAGSPEAVRDPKGMSVKFQTEDGILDLICINHPVFYVRDPVVFPSFIHASKRNPKTHLPDADMVWDFLSLRPETTNQMLHQFSEEGIPNGWRRMNAYPINVFKLVKGDQYVYCKFIFICQNVTADAPQYLSDEQASKVDPDYYSMDLYNAIEFRNPPTWKLKVQIMTEQRIRQFTQVGINLFDVTREWPENALDEFIDVGTLVLNRNPTNYFAEVEQLAFSPSHLVPGIEPSIFDKLLLGRMFVYPDAQRYRLGANYQQLGPNRPLHEVKNFQRDGPQTYFHQGEEPSYHPNSFGGPDSLASTGPTTKLHEKMSEIDRFPTLIDYSEATNYYEHLSPEKKGILNRNLSKSLKGANRKIQLRMLGNLYSVSRSLGDYVAKQLSLPTIQ